jgi:pimeloyl-ACP methyl ester carboxylesterase
VNTAQTLERDGTRVAYLASGSGSPPVVLLHGLAGYAGEWSQTASWMERDHRVVSLEARGHGASERHPDDVSRSAHVADAAFAIEQLQLGPSIVVGQSMGGLTAMLLAAARPELVSALIVVEAFPVAPDEATIKRVADWLARWPVPFASREDAVKFLGEPSSWAEGWAAGLEAADDGLRPWFDPEVMARTLRDCGGSTYWDEWASIDCPTLIVAGESGTLPPGAAEKMVELLPASRYARVAGAGHDLHIEQPDRWRAVAEEFLAWLD